MKEKLRDEKRSSVKNKDSKPFLSLKTNFLPILLSPRVDEIPKPFMLTVFIVLLVVLFSGGVVVIFNTYNNDVLCEATPLPISTSKSIVSCANVLVRKDFVKDQTFPTNLEDEREVERIESTIQLLIFNPELFDEKDLVLDSSDIDQILIELERISITSASLNASDVLIDLGLFFDDLDFIDEVSIDLLELNDDDFFEIEENELESNNQQRESLVLDFTTEIGASCKVTIQPISSIDSLITGSCDLIVENEEVFRILYTTSLEKNLFASLASYLINVHVEDIASISTSSFTDINEVTSLEEIITSSSSFCCVPNDLDPLDAFGLISGFGFALEGWLTFFFAITLFRGKLGVKAKSEVSESKMVYEVSERKEESKDKIFDSDLKRKMYVSAGSKYLDSVDLQRAVFNPRCRSIPHAIPVSTLTFIVLICFALYLARLLQTIRIEELCAVTIFLEATDEKCTEPPIVRFFTFEDTDSDENVEGFGSLPLDFTLTTFGFNDFKTSDFLLTSTVMDEVNAACTDDDGLGNDLFCLHDVPSFELTFNNSFLQGNDDSANSSLQGTQVDVADYRAKSQTGRDISISVDREVDEFSSSIKIKLDVIDPVFKYQVSTEVESKNVLNTGFKAISQASLLLRTFIAETLQENSFEEKIDIILEVEKTSVRCCEDVSLNYFEYLGIMLGYLSLAEGFLTLSVAAVTYVIASLLGFW